MFFLVRLRGNPVEHKVGTVMNQRRTYFMGRARERSDAKGIHVQCADGIFFGAINIVVCTAVHNDRRPHIVRGREDRGIVGDIKLLSSQRDHLVCPGEVPGNGTSKLARCTRNKDLHRGVIRTPSFGWDQAGNKRRTQWRLYPRHGASRPLHKWL